MNEKDYFTFLITTGANRARWVEVNEIDYYAGRTMREAMQFIRTYCAENNCRPMCILKEIKHDI